MKQCFVSGRDNRNHSLTAARDGNFSAAPVFADGRIYFFGEEGGRS
jgi:hypothetical protein